MATTTTSSADNTRTTAEAESLQAKIDVSVSRARNLVALLLPAQRYGTQEDDSETDEDLFKPMPPRHVLSIAQYFQLD